MTPFVRPICMDWDNKYEREQLQNGNSGKVMGWGVNEEGVSSSELRAINLPYVDFQTCFTAVPEDFKNFITTDKFCAGYLNGSSVCNGDSGGGLSFELDRRWILRGVVSSGPAAQFMCNTNYYTTFTKVGSYLRFIRNSTFKPRNFLEEKDSTIRVITPTVSMDDPTTTIPVSGCILPEQPTGGSFQLGSCTGQCNVTTGLRVPINTSLVYRCNENYMLQGNSITICKNNGWYLPPTCFSKCGTAIPDGTQLIVNGSTVTHGRFPWVAEIYDESLDRCEGTLISPNLVISTAYCFGNETEYNARNTSEYMVFVGKYLPAYDTLEPYAQKSRVKRIDIAADYTGKRGNYDNNVALIHVESPFTMTMLVRPICIHWDNRVDHGELGNLKSEKVVGWRVPAAATVINGSHTISPSYISHEECLVRVGQRYKHYLTADTFCAIYCSNGSSVCKGDVYASAFGYKSHGLWYLLGVKQININPEHSPRNWAAVFSNVGYFLDWIYAAYVSAR